MDSSNEVGIDPDRKARGNIDDEEYDRYLLRIQERYRSAAAYGPLFETDVVDLFDTYLSGFYDEERQFHNCHSCREFINRYGGLVAVGPAGALIPALWSEEDAPAEYHAVVHKMIERVSHARITNPFYSELAVLGRPVTGIWHHLSVAQRPDLVHRSRVQTAEQRMAEKKEEFRMVVTALGEFPPAVVNQAVTILEADALSRSDKVLGQAKWMADLHALPIQGRRNLTWLAVATAPTGYCHPRASMIGSLLEDIQTGMSFESVRNRWQEKMHPLRYQRSQAAPTAGSIVEAEKLVAKLGIARSLERRFLRPDEVKALWVPATPADGPAPTGVFGRVKAKGEVEFRSMQLPEQVFTWDKFQRDVLPNAEQISVLVPARGAFTSLLTATHDDAPPIIQWDREDARNPVSWYYYHGGSLAANFGLLGGRYAPLTAIAHKPSMWGEGDNDHHGKGVMFVIGGARDLNSPEVCLFPEILKSELHGVRAVIEAYSKSTKATGDVQTAGLMFSKGEGVRFGTGWDVKLRVTSKGKVLDYKLDRWD